MVTFADLLAGMVARGASDLYITVDSPPMYRVDGVLHAHDERLLEARDTEALAQAVMSPAQQQEFNSCSEMNLGLYDKQHGRFRVNLFRQRCCVGLVVRQIRSDIPTLEGLGLPPIFREISSSKRGLVLMVGATGSGKSTALAAMIGYRNQTASGHIITVEDPIEFVHTHKRSLVSQREIGIDTPSLQSALKSALRQAPDVILIGEIRDADTMDAAISFAETGHLCLATLHSNNAYQALERVLSFFPADRHPQLLMQLSLNLRAILSQRLVAAVAGKRVAAVEILLDTPRMKDLILKGQLDQIKEAIELGGSAGMQSFDQHLYELYAGGTISLEEALKNADSANNLRVRVRLAEAETGQTTAPATAAGLAGTAAPQSLGLRMQDD
jgi:twitching motility protein PilU